MPTYDFFCKKCQTDQEVICTMKYRKRRHLCSTCNYPLIRKYVGIDHYWHDCEQPKGYVNRKR